MVIGGWWFRNSCTSRDEIWVWDLSFKSYALFDNITAILYVVSMDVFNPHDKESFFMMLCIQMRPKISCQNPTGST